MIKSSEAYQDAVVADARRIYVKAVVDIEDPDLVQGEISGPEQEPGISRQNQIWDKNFSLNARYASLEPGRLILDGSYVLRPEDSAERDWQAGFVGAELSGEDGTFQHPQVVQITFSGVDVLQACAVAFSDVPEDGVAADFTVEIISGGVVYHTQSFTGNAKALPPIVGFRVNRPDCIRVTVTRWSLPRRRMRIAEIVPGIYEVWTGDEMAEFFVKMQGDPSCLTLPYGIAAIAMDNQSRRFDPRTKGGIFLMLEERQGISLYIGVLLPDGTVDYKPLGVFYQANGGWKDSDNGITMKWDLADIVGLLANRKFKPPKPLPTTLQGWLEALAGQLGKNFTGRVRVDPEYGNLPVTFRVDGEANGTAAELLAEMSCGDILRYVCMATGTWPRADQTTGYLAAEPAWNEGNKITLDNLNKYPTMAANEDVASVTVNGYSADGTAPACDNTVDISNPFSGSMDSVAQTRSLLSYYGGNKLETLGRGDPSSEIGDVDTIELAEGNATTARRVKQELCISGGVLRDCTSTFVRGDGLFLFSKRAQFLESGTFTVPGGVYRIRAVLVGHGHSGGAGAGGKWNNSSNMSMGEYSYPQTPNGGNGVNGANGSGGKVWTGILDVNPGQVIEIVVGDDATLLHCSSADGKVYPNGFTDVATGDVYGRSGVGNPQPGSGDGGAGGKGGTAGSWYVRGHWYYDDGYTPPPGSSWITGVDPSHDAPGHWEQEVVITRQPTSGKPGVTGATGSAIIYWEPPEGIDDDNT